MAKQVSQRSGGRPVHGTERRRAIDEGAMDFTIEELREFLEGDLSDLPVDPGFKERLRRKLWDMVIGRRPPAKPDPEA